MTVNIVNEVIEKEDLEIMENIAKKYNMNLVELGRFIGKGKNEKGVRPHVRFSKKELEIVDEKAEKLKYSRSALCVVAYQWFIKSEEYKRVNILDLREEKNNRTERVCVSFSDAKEYQEMRNLAKGFSISFPGLIRYCALNYPIDYDKLDHKF